MKIICFLCLSFFTMACQSPASMFYQRSEYKVQRIGNLMVSTSPQFSRRDFVATENEILLEESWILQNVDTKTVEVSVGNAVAKIKDKSYPIACHEEGRSVDTIKVNPTEKVLLRCKWAFPKKPASNSDLWVTFVVPVANGESITSHKIVRAEDFQ